MYYYPDSIKVKSDPQILSSHLEHITVNVVIAPQMYAEWLPDFKDSIAGEAGEGIILFVVAVQVNVQGFLAAELGRTAQVTAGQCIALLNGLYQMEPVFVKTQMI